MNRETAAVETRGLGRVFVAGDQRVEALRAVDLEVARGEFVAVMGPSGCGKSTLLHLAAGLDTPTTGEVWVDGARVDTLREADRAVLRRRTVGLVFQAYNLVPNLTVSANVELPGLLARRPRAEVAAAREELLEVLGLADKAAAFPGELSGGQQQRAAIARALVNQPTVLLADEPTGNLDTGAGADVLDLVSLLHERGQTTVLVTHDAKVAAVANRVVFMRDGRLVDETVLTVDAGADTILARLVQLEP